MLRGPIPIDDVSIFEVELVASVQVRQVCDSLNIDEDHDLGSQKGLDPCVIAARIDQHHGVVQSPDSVVAMIPLKAVQYNTCSLAKFGNRKFLEGAFCKSRTHVGCFRW